MQPLESAALLYHSAVGSCRLLHHRTHVFRDPFSRKHEPRRAEWGLFQFSTNRGEPSNATEHARMHLSHIPQHTTPVHENWGEWVGEDLHARLCAPETPLRNSAQTSPAIPSRNAAEYILCIRTSSKDSDPNEFGRQGCNLRPDAPQIRIKEV